jgi:hypothetical protein
MHLGATTDNSDGSSGASSCHNVFITSGVGISAQHLRVVLHSPHWNVVKKHQHHACNVSLIGVVPSFLQRQDAPDPGLILGASRFQSCLFIQQHGIMYAIVREYMICSCDCARPSVHREPLRVFVMKQEVPPKVIGACMKQMHPGCVWEFLKGMQCQGLVPDIFAYSALISTRGQGHQPQFALGCAHTIAAGR